MPDSISVGQVYNEQDFNALAAEHKGLCGTAPYTKENALGDKKEVPGHLVHTFCDGTKVTAKYDQNDQGRMNVSVIAFEKPATKDTGPRVVSSASDTERNIAVQDPAAVTPENPLGITKAENPAFDQGKADEAAATRAAQRQREEQAAANAAQQRKLEQAKFDYEKQQDQIKQQTQLQRDKLTLLVEQGKLDADQAKEQYHRWYTENVVLPFQAMQEQRARATEQRTIEQEQRRRQELGASDEVARTKFGYDAGQDAIANELKLLPYRTGPAFGEQFAGALNTISQGGGPVNFTADAFNFQAPDLAGIAQSAAQQAVGQYRPLGERLGGAGADPNVVGTPQSPTDYTNLPVPDLSQAPQQQTPNLLDIWNKTMGAYSPGG